MSCVAACGEGPTPSESPRETDTADDAETDTTSETEGEGSNGGSSTGGAPQNQDPGTGGNTTPDDSGGDGGSLGMAGQAGVAESPCGLYTLSSRAESSDGLRLLGQREEDFIAGFVARVGWSDLEAEAGSFDFSVVEEVLSRAEDLSQRVTLQILGAEPAHVLADAEQTWTWFDPNPRHTGDCSDEDGCERPLPWDEGALLRQAELFTRLSNHEISYRGSPVRLGDHPLLDQVLLPLVGWGRIRELGFEVEEWPGYSRVRLVEATVNTLGLHFDVFPQQVHQVQFFPVHDEIRSSGEELWRDLLHAIVNEYVGGGEGRLLFLTENLAHSARDMGDVFGPSPDQGTGRALLAAHEQGGPLGFQMLTSWAQPFPGQEMAVEGGDPISAINWAHITYDARYFEVYSPDVDAAVNGQEPWLEDFRLLSEVLCEPD